MSFFWVFRMFLFICLYKEETETMNAIYYTSLMQTTYKRTKRFGEINNSGSSLIKVYFKATKDSFGQMIIYQEIYFKQNKPLKINVMMPIW